MKAYIKPREAITVVDDQEVGYEIRETMEALHA
jgi:hypothetical protein